MGGPAGTRRKGSQGEPTLRAGGHHGLRNGWRLDLKEPREQPAAGPAGRVAPQLGRDAGTTAPAASVRGFRGRALTLKVPANQGPRHQKHPQGPISALAPGTWPQLPGRGRAGLTLLRVPQQRKGPSTPGPECDAARLPRSRPGTRPAVPTTTVQIRPEIQTTGAVDLGSRQPVPGRAPLPSAPSCTLQNGRQRSIPASTSPPETAQPRPDYLRPFQNRKPDAGATLPADIQDPGGGSRAERDTLTDLEFEVGSLPEGPESTAASGHCSSVKEKQAEACAAGVRRAAAAEDRIQESQLRRHLDLLDRMQEEKDFFIQKTREELRTCRQRMDLLSKQQETVAAEMAREREASNTAAVGRLQASSRRLHTELENERDLQSRITAMLKENENAMWHIEMEKGRFQDLHQPSLEEAEARGRHLQGLAAQRLLKEKEAAEKAERNQRLRVGKSLHVQRELGLEHQRRMEDAQRNHKVAIEFLKVSLGRAREQEKKQETESRQVLKQRMDAVLALKSSITANRETLRKIQAWGRARAALAEQKASAEKEAILAQGGDAFKHLFHHRRRQHLEAQRRTFQEEQQLRKQEIVGRILKEEAEEESRKKKQLRPARAAVGRTLRDKTWNYIANICTGKMATMATSLPLEAEAAHPETSLLLKVISSESVQGDPGTTSGEEETLAEPEIPGLWQEDCAHYQELKEDVGRKPVGGTKMDKDILARTVAQLRSRVIHKQVVSGREFKGRPFNSKPQLVHFKDFEVGEVYKKKITLVNATYTINYCSLVGVDESLRDFVHIGFDPPGPMSAGMSCEVLVTFKPMINKDLEGSISFLAQTGSFSVPLKCSTKKCSLSLDKELINFGSYVVGETTSRTITLTNVGGLGTKFKVLPASEACEMDEEPSPLLNISSLLTSEDKSACEKGLASVSEQQLEGKTSLLDTQSRKELERMEEQEGTSATGGLATFPSEEQAEITLGETTEGEIGPFSSVRVPVVFTPVIPGEVQTEFKVMFKNPKCPTLYFRAKGVAIDVPVWVPKPNLDLKICMYDRLYQDSVPIHTRSKVALRLKFEVCKELRGHVELLPETGYIQAHSTYSVQLKFLPRHSLPEDAGKYFDKESRVLEAPMTIWVADQMKPVGFTIQAIVTTSDLELNPQELDFGYCTIYQALRTEIVLYNPSLLPQEFGFVGLPKFVDIQPNDGFGTILPLEALQLDVIFQPTKAKEYSFELVCKSEVNRCFKMSCRAVGVQPPLELSHYQIKFAATPLYDTSVARLYVLHSHPAVSSLPHSGPHTDSEEVSPVGATTFEFLLPSDSPITISPLVGTVLPGKRCLVQVAFRPVLTHARIHEEALQILNKEIQDKLFRKDTLSQRKELWRQSLSVLRLRTRDRLLRAVAASHPPQQQKQELRVSSHDYQIAQAALARNFQGKFEKFVVPCVMASGDVKDRKGSEPLTFSVTLPTSPHNTLYLELWCPAVAPSIVVTSNKGKTTFHFGDIAVEFSVLNPNGPFSLLNPFSKLCSGETQVLMLSFSPRESILAQETLDVISEKGNLTLTLTGMGVASMVTCSIEGNVLNMGYVLARESVSSSFKLQNDSSLPIKFSMRLESLSSTRALARQQLPQFLATPTRRTDFVGTQNHNGQSVFSVLPVEGVMDPGKEQDCTVTFSPDHESLYFSDRLQVVLFEKKISHQILLQGAAREHAMFVEGGDPLDVPVESLAAISAVGPEHREEAEELKPILVTLDYVQFDADTPAPPATRELQVGCIRTTQLSPKKPDHPLMVSALLQLRGDVKETYKVILVANVVTGS
ncbi:Cilia- and flagella-associated protein 74 [Sciurus carolinensis]|uniref:Cilia- and flagella-associated protein 74 n=1 Tax=Sciurus carolinensis TaxID=30640 RepID=A0AA41N2C1_SCICA|nr:Cilia- and flagella-associated protein 74 [Sciurus carolinensis]